MLRVCAAVSSGLDRIIVVLQQNDVITPTRPSGYGGACQQFLLEREVVWGMGFIGLPQILIRFLPPQGYRES